MVTLESPSSGSCAAVVDVADASPFTVRETTPNASPKPRLLERVRDAIRSRHYSRRTEKTYIAWIPRYIASGTIAGEQTVDIVRGARVPR
ncbi:MAG: phage integrase N-terminal SAM-like domain-containing protein [Candidatus Rokubacteria bacterium]|nr:phage integrase N-terminal SAM-like domain-containing protein [Candidatus Rokubacteria bacterium]